MCAAPVAHAGSIGGTVGFKGKVTPTKLVRKSDPVCAKKDFNDETVLPSKDGKALANVVVRITTNIPPSGDLPKDPVKVEQIDCIFRPRVQGAVEGQDVVITNEDKTLHNIHTYSGTRTIFNVAQPPTTPPMTKKLPSTDVVKVKCDVHPWMAAFIVLHKHPYFAVSAEDGKFEIKNVPPGTYKVEAWHEKLGTQVAEVTVGEGAPADPHFSFEAK